MKQKFLYSILFMCQINICIAQKIPITSSSTEAINHYKKAFENENLLMLDDAEKLYHKALKLDPSFALAHFRLGMLRDNYDYRKEKLNEALKYINNVSEGEKLWIMARIDFYSNGYDGTKEYGYLKELVEMYPEDEIANYLFGFVNIHHGGNDTKKALKHFKKAIALKRDFVAALNELAYAYMDVGEYDNAKEVTARTIKLLPNTVNPLDTYAEIFMRSGDYKESIKKYNKVLSIDDSSPWAIMGITANLNFLGRHAEGREFLNKLENSKLSDYEYRHKWRAKVVSFLDEGDFTNAINTLEKQKQESLNGTNKREPVFHIYYSFLRKTRLYFENNQFEKGFKEYRDWCTYIEKNIENESTKSRVKSLEAYYQAYTLFIKDDLNGALEKMIQLNSHSPNEANRLLLAKIYINQKKAKMAITILTETDLSDPYGQFLMMIANANHKNFEKAKKYRDKIINLNERNNINLALVRNKALQFDF